jgi:homoserine kinase
VRTTERTAVAAGQRVSVRVPATSANLGPGFDCLGLAVTLYDRVTVESTDDGVFSAQVSGEGAADLPRDGSHLILATIQDTLGRVGYESGGLRLEAENVIPHGRGLGSSAAAIVSAVLLANALLPAEDRLSDQEVLQLCSAQEGHPDNVAPALAGRLAISWETSGSFFSTAVDVHPDIIPIVAIPSYELSTETARGLLPVSVPHHVAAANGGRAALLVQALTHDPSLLLPATVDALHQSHRAPAMAPSAELMEALRASGFASVVSGAGPTVMTLARGRQQADRILEQIHNIVAASSIPDGWRVLELEVDTDGAKVEVHRRN